MRQHHPITPPPQQRRGASPLTDELSGIFDAIDDAKILTALARYRWTGRPGWSLRALWRAYLAGFMLSLPTTNALVRRLQDDPALRAVCGFGSDLPSRWTFCRFISRLSQHPELLEGCLAQLTNRLHEILPGFGQGLAVDATTVRTHSNPNRRTVSDGDATWTRKKAPNGRLTWYFGYKLHLISDARYELPIMATITTASVNDSREFIPVLEKARTTYEWFDPAWISADAGYDAKKHYEYVVDVLKAVPIIKLNARGRKAKYAQRYVDWDGAPRCIGGNRMTFIGYTAKGKLHYACQAEDCHGARGVEPCRAEIIIDPAINPRRYALIPREPDAWRALYRKRQSVERTFSRLKGHRTLNDHARRGLRKVTLHILMSVLTLQADAVARAEAGDIESVRHCTRRVA